MEICIGHDGQPCVWMSVNLPAQTFRHVFLSAYLVFLHSRLSVSLGETPLSHIILWHSNFPLDYWMKNSQVIEKRDAWLWPSHNDTETEKGKWRTESDSMPNDLPYSLCINSFCYPSFWYLCPLLSSRLDLSFSNVVYLEFHSFLLSSTLLCYIHIDDILSYWTCDEIKPNNNPHYNCSSI